MIQFAARQGAAKEKLLAAANFTQEALTDEIRKELALSYLRQPDLSLTDIAALLGYSDSSTFSRSFKRWVGMAPREWRAQH
jgi:AraC-like DNA-binding protein